MKPFVSNPGVCKTLALLEFLSQTKDKTTRRLSSYGKSSIIIIHWPRTQQDAAIVKEYKRFWCLPPLRDGRALSIRGELALASIPVGQVA